MIEKNSLLYLIYKAHRKLSELESTPRDYGTGDLLYSSHIHTIESVAHQPGCNLTNLAADLGVTKPAAFKFVRKLLEMDYLIKEQSEDNLKEVAFYLSKKGKKAAKAHINFEHKVFGPLEVIQAELTQEERIIISNFMVSLSNAISW
jgi:DNA-binding MarR family transcriptional regulator